jgi:hypothetical protein
MPHGIPIIPTATSGAPPANARPGAIWAINGQIVIYNGIQWVPFGNASDEDPMAEFHVSYKAYNVNTKRLVQRIVDAVDEVVKEFVFQRFHALSKTYDFTQLVEYLELYLRDMYEEKQVIVYDVIGDHRNNHPDDVQRGHIVVEILFQQFNCLNMTRIVFLIEKK